MTMRKCTRCLTPETVDTITYDAEGVCSVCRQVEFKQDKIDWADRQRQLDEIVAEHKGKGLYLSLIPIPEPTRLRRISYAVFFLKKKNTLIWLISYFCL